MTPRPNLIAAQRPWLRVEAPHDAARPGELLATAHPHRVARDARILDLRAAAAAFDRLDAALDYLLRKN